MTKEQRLFLVQARSNYAVFDALRKDDTLPRCHALYSLQIATELLGKAYGWRNGPIKPTHRALVPFLLSLSANPKAQRQLGFSGQNANWKHLLRKSFPLASEIERLAPALAGDGPNAEYPWPRFPNNPTDAPVEFAFPLWAELTETAHGRQFLKLLAELFSVAEAYL